MRGQFQYTLALAAVCLTISARSLNGAEPLRMQVSPTVSRAPALLTVRVTVEPAADDRLLQVIAESPTFYRSSEIPLDGTTLKVFEFKNLPSGLYQVTGVLVGAHGPHASVLRLAKVEPAIGSGR